MAEIFPSYMKFDSFGLCFVILCFTSGIFCYDNHKSNKNEPDCTTKIAFEDSSEVTEKSAGKRFVSKHGELLLVSTLDGRLSALDPAHGKLIWSQKTGHGELLSSTISKLEIPDKGRWVRLIPSLDGNLYKFDGSSLEPVPFSAETLLKSSFKLGDDTIITGGTESRNYGICLLTGQLRYACSVKECSRGEPFSLEEDILIVKRMTWTVRGIEPRTGIEKWNFSVGEHQITFMEGINGDYKNNLVTDDQLVGHADAFATSDYDSCDTNSDVEIKVSMPEGLILLYDRLSVKKWSYKLESPVVNIWHFKNGLLSVVDLFNQNTMIGWNGNNQFAHKLPTGTPLLYVGFHENQPYIKHSPTIQSKMMNALKHHAHMPDFLLPQMQWRPYLVSASSRTPVVHVGRNDISEPLQITQNEASTALILRNEFDDYPYDSGYYLYDITSHSTQFNNSTVCPSEQEEKEETLDQIIIVSLWHWWKEVLGISIITSAIVNLLITQHMLNRMQRQLIQESSASLEIQSIQTNAVNVTEMCFTNGETIPGKHEEIVDSSVPEFVSRYLSDFEPVQCLGKGGFGVVFESRNKLDDCSYAVKRICLPNRNEARDRVMREVKALAKLDHAGIVRYFNAWLECPPPRWQELKDKEWDDCFKTSSTPYSSTTVSPGPGSSLKEKDRNPLKPFGTVNQNSSISCIRDRKHKSSFIIDKQLSNSTNCLASSGSFEVIFNTNPEGGDIWPNQDKESSFTESEGISNSSSAGKLPFRRYHNNISTNISRVDESHYADHSESNEELETKFDESINRHSVLNTTSGHLTRPNTLNMTNTLNMNTKKLSTEISPKIYLYIQMQLCRKESLKDWLNTNSTERNREEIFDIFDQIVCAVQYVHECGLMHRDLKPSNIFFSLDGTIKIGDFGLVTAMSGNEVHTPYIEHCSHENKIESKHTDQVGTQLYMSLEQIAGNGYNQKVDIFSLGIIFFELLNPFPTQMERIKILMNVRNQKYPEAFQQKYPNECKFITKILSHDPEKRPSASEIREHPFFKEFQPQPSSVVRVQRRRTLSQRMSLSGSDCESITADGSSSMPSVSR